MRCQKSHSMSLLLKFCRHVRSLHLYIFVFWKGGKNPRAWSPGCGRSLLWC
ncbi:hypothetical protein BDA96_06G301800 [Sorghum bicolor]|nr:hypothetical protein BDA96_06G301800 [Sorghum bicolor]